MAKKKATKSDFTDTAHNVWLAGLGAMASAGDEGQRLFKTLVARGRKVEKQVSRPMNKAGADLRGTVKQVRARAGKSLGSIQATIDDSVGAALHKLGVPTRKEIAELNRRVEKLTRALNGRGAGKASTRKTAKKTTKKAASKKKTAKPRTTRKPAR